MARTLRYLFVLLFIGVTGITYGQSSPGEISGRVLDEKKEPVINAVVEAAEGGIVKGGAVTDFDGNYVIKPIDAGRYDVTIKALNYKQTTVTGTIVNPDRATNVNFSLELSSKALEEHVVIAYKVPLIDRNGGGATTLTAEQIEKMPTRDIADMAATTTSVYQAQRGSNVSLGGGRTEGTLYIIDGVQMQGQGFNLAQGSIDQIEVLVSGIPAKFGDATGGVINITTKGVSQKYTGSILAQHSIDGYNNNLVNFTISGPIYKRKMADGTKKPLMGFSLSGDYYDDHDRYPFYDKQYTAKSDVLANLQQNPLVIHEGASGAPVIFNSTSFVQSSDLTAVKVPANNDIKEGRVNGKLEFQLADNLNLTAGGTFDYTRAQEYSRGLDLFSPDATPVLNTYSGTGYLRFTQRFGKVEKAAGDKPSVISNAYYSIQADFQRNNQEQKDPRFGDNIFNYQYVGKFNQQYTPFYGYGQDSTTKRTGVIFEGNIPTSVTFDRSNLNPNLANYTTDYYNLYQSIVGPGALPQNISVIQNFGMTNGDLPQYVYGLFNNVGTSINSYSKFNSDQYALDVNASFDLQVGKTRHAIEFGLYYQQRIEKSFSVSSNLQGFGTLSLWQLMRQYTNTQISLDKSNPIFVINGHRYTANDVNSHVVTPSATDTILYNYKSNTDAQNVFDRNLRIKLGLDPNGTDMINVDALDPSTFSLGMFTADELSPSGNHYINYEGYTYTGATQTGNVNFNDYFTQKDANGNYTRPIAAFSPNYIAGYLLDKFDFKDVHFNVGVRVDRYDANTNVLKDPYSLYQEASVANVDGSRNTLNGGTHPSNIGSGYVVYVNSQTNPTIVGYRNGDNWYDATGKFIEDPTVLKTYTGGVSPIPYLTAAGASAKITDSNFNANNSFKNYTPQVNVAPRLAFSFPISDVSDFYGHYDIYVQRPTNGIDANASAYYYLPQNEGSFINNPDLKPQKTIDYEVGFQQKLTEQSSLTLSAYYKERKDMITVRFMNEAFPADYYTYANRDFSTTKGLGVKYDLRRLGHLRMTLSYTLQFAEGTGSSPTSGVSGGLSNNSLLANFIEAGLPNLRYVSALDIDSRHNIVANIDYRFNDGEGPIVGGSHILQNAGLNFILKARSGEPYTSYVFPDNVSRTVIGGVNGSRLPWHYGVDVRLDKDFALNNLSRKHTDGAATIKPKRPLFLTAFIYAQNVLNIRDILSVYGYTGRPNDNGYLSSPFGQQYLNQQIDPAAYANFYSIAYNDPSKLNYHRTINFGLQFSF